MECGSAELQDSGEPDLLSYFRENCLQWILKQLDSTNVDFGVFGGMHLQLVNKFETLLQCAGNMIGQSYSKLALPRIISSFLVPIQPGLFKGTYGEYGIQLIVLEYISERFVRATKITV